MRRANAQALFGGFVQPANRDTAYSSIYTVQSLIALLQPLLPIRPEPVHKAQLEIERYLKDAAFKDVETAIVYLEPEAPHVETLVAVGEK